MEIVISLTGCTQEEAEKVLRECNGDTVEAVDRILNIPVSKFTPKKKELDETQRKFAEMRQTLDAMNADIESGFLTKKDQRDCSSSPKLTRTHALRPVESLSDSHHTQQNQIEVPELEEQTPETVYQ